jgi:hypothetical protein
VRDLLDRQSASGVAEGGVAPAPPMAAESMASAAKTPGASRAGAMVGAVLARMRHLAPAAEAAQVAQTARSTRSTWERIPLASDVELHVRRPLSREQNRQVERLLEAARDLFAEEP